MMIYFQSVLLLLLFCFFINNAYGNLPDDFDALMEKFFETPECESFVSDATYLSVATSACSPYTCDAPRQLCMREANRYQDETANQCRTVPDSCLTAANGGIPVASSRTIHTTPSPSVFGGMRGNPSATINGNRPPPRIVTAPPDFRGTPPPPPRPFTSGAFGDICQQTVPDGRFCGFQLKFTYNRETGNCEQFWFPGCATDKTNDNLFGDFQSCQIATKHCRATPTQPPPPPPPPPTQPPPPPPHRYTTAFPDYPNSGEEIPPPPPPPPISSRGSSTGGVDLGSLAGSFMGGGGNAGGLVGQFLGGGLGGGGGSSGANIGGGTPNGYGGGALGGGGGGGGNGIGGGGGGGQPNFLKLITNAVGAVGAAKQAAGGAPAGGGAQWLKNIDPQQITSIFSSFGR